METPLSTKRITRSQTKAAAATNTVPMSRKSEEVPESKQRNGAKSDRSALIDITNDSPIVGLAMGSLKTPSSFSKKKDLPKMRMMTTPGSGEALLRREVKTLLQKVEEEAEGSKLLSFEHHRLFLRLEDHVDDSSSSGVRPPMTMIHNVFFNLPSTKSNGSVGMKGNSQVVERIDGGLKEERVESEKSLITRSLLFDFSEKSSSAVETSSEASSICSSVGSVSQVLLQSDEEEEEEEVDGVWSIRVVNNNKSSSIIQSKEEEEEEYYYEEESEGGLMIDELCEGVMRISVNEKIRRINIAPEFEGKHTRFVYNSEDEIEGEEEEDVVVRTRKSPLHLKGLPTPTGKHLRFSNEDAEEQDYY